MKILGTTAFLAVLLAFPAAAGTLPPEADPICAAHYQIGYACNAANAFVHPEAPLCIWPVPSVVPCALFANPVIQNDAGAGRDAGDNLETAVPVLPAFHRANIAPAVDQVDVFTFEANAGDSLRFRFDGAVTMVLRDPEGNALSTDSFDGTVPSTGTYSVWGSARDRPYNYYFCFVLAGEGSPFC